MKTNALPYLFGAPILVLLAACSAHLMSGPYAPSFTAPSQGPTYRLVETVLLLQLPMAIHKTGSNYSARVSKPPTVTVTSRPSPTLIFTLDLSEFEKAAVKLAKFEFKTDPHGVLTTLNVDSSDSSAEIIGNSLTVLGNLATAVAVFGKKQATPTLVEGSEHVLERYIAISEFPENGEFLVPKTEIQKLFPQNLTGGKELDLAEIDQVILKIKASDRDDLKSLNAATSSSIGGAKPKGIIVGVPKTTTLTLSIPRYGEEAKEITVANLGGFTLIPVGHSRFTSRTNGLTIDPTTGTLTLYSRTSDSAGANASKTLADSTSKLLTLAKDLKTADEVEATRLLKADYDLTEMQKNLLTSQKAAEALKNPDPVAAETARLTAENAFLTAQTNLAKARAASDPDLLQAQADKAKYEAALDAAKKNKELQDFLKSVPPPAP